MSLLLALFLFLSPPTLSEDLLFTMQTLRHIRLDHPLFAEWKTKQEFKQYITQKMEKEFPEDKRQMWEMFLKAMQLMSKGTKIGTIILTTYTNYVAGYYDPETRKLYIIQGAGMPEKMRLQSQEFLKKMAIPISLNDFFLSHEIVHALQDDRYDLQHFVPNETLTTDEKMARTAIVEGDATLMQYLFLANKMGLQEDAFPFFLKSFLKKVNSQFFGIAPGSFFLSLMAFPYIQGLPFVAQAYLKGGVDKIENLFRHPPASSEQLLHPKKYRHDLPLRIKAWQEGRQAKEQDRLGEFFLRLALQARGAKNADELAAGWGNDALYLFSPAGFAWEIIWDDTPAAVQFAEGARQSWQKIAVLRKGSRVCLSARLTHRIATSFQQHCRSANN